MPTNSLSRSKVRGDIYDAYERFLDETTLSEFTLFLDSDTPIETYRWPDNISQMREFHGTLGVRNLSTHELNIPNRQYKGDVLGIPIVDFERDQTKLLQARVNEIAEVAAELPWDLTIELLNNGHTTNIGPAFDGKPFFSDDHVLGESGTINNEPTASQIPALNVGTATAPTAEEVSKIIPAVTAYFMSMKNDAGRPLNRRAKALTFAMNPGLFAAFESAIVKDNLAGGETNVVKAAGYSIKLIADPRITATDAFYALIRDASTRPILIQEEKAVEFVEFNEDNAVEWCESNDAIGYMPKWRGRAYYGDWRRALKATLS